MGRRWQASLLVAAFKVACGVIEFPAGTNGCHWSMDEPPPYHLDIEGLDDPLEGSRVRRGGKHRPWVGIWFDCCGVYTRVYRNAAATAYHGYCPRCARGITLRVGEGGTDARFFLAE